MPGMISSSSDDGSDHRDHRLCGVGEWNAGGCDENRLRLEDALDRAEPVDQHRAPRRDEVCTAIGHVELGRNLDGASHCDGLDLNTERAEVAGDRSRVRRCDPLALKPCGMLNW